MRLVRVSILNFARISLTQRRFRESFAKVAQNYVTCDRTWPATPLHGAPERRAQARQGRRRARDASEHRATRGYCAWVCVGCCARELVAPHQPCSSPRDQGSRNFATPPRGVSRNFARCANPANFAAKFAKLLSKPTPCRHAEAPTAQRRPRRPARHRFVEGRFRVASA